MRVLAVVVMLLACVALLCWSWWDAMFLPRPAGSLAPDPVVTIGVVLIVQVLAWNIVYELPSDGAVRLFLGVGLPVLTTLATLTLTSVVLTVYCDWFFANGPHPSWEKEDAVWGTAMMMVYAGIPAFLVAAVLMLMAGACRAVWKRRVRKAAYAKWRAWRARHAQPDRDAVSTDE